MAFGKTFVLCSQFNGRLVTGEDVPAAGVRVERSWEWGWTGDKGGDEAVTAADGSFSFPEVTGRSMTAGFVPHEPSVPQQITAHGPDGPVRIFSVEKNNYERDGELAGRGLSGPGINLVCRLDAKPSGDGPFWGTCQPMK